MVRPIVIATLLGLATVRACAQVDFTPKESFYLAEATKVVCVAFRNGSSEVSYTQPHAWILSGGGSKLTLTPPEDGQAQATMGTDTTSPRLPATEENLKAYAERAVKQLPREASKVKVAESVISSLRLSKREMVEVTLTYALYGQQFTSNTLYLPHEHEIVIFHLTARTGDYQRLQRSFRASLYSLQGL
jgi:hypothetical protein